MSKTYLMTQDGVALQAGRVKEGDIVTLSLDPGAKVRTAVTLVGSCATIEIDRGNRHTRRKEAAKRRRDAKGSMTKWSLL